MCRCRCRGILVQQALGGLACGDDERLVVHRVGEAQQRRARLSRAEELARPADREVAARDLEAIVGLEHRLQARLRGVGERRAVEQHADARAAAAADAAAQLVQLRQAEALGVLDDHERCVGHVDADLDHRRCDEDRDLAAGEERHHGRLLGGRHAAVQQADHPAGQRRAELAVRRGRVLQVERGRLVDERTDPVRLPAARRFVADARDHLVASRVGEQLGDDRRAAGRQLVDRADVEVGEQRHRQRARDRRRRHHEEMRLELTMIELGSIPASGTGRDRPLPSPPPRGGGSNALVQLRAQRQPLCDAEAVLLVDDRETEAREAHLLFDHRVRADDEPGFARRDLREHRVARLALAAAGQPGNGDAERREPADELLQMLLGQDLGRRHQRALPAGVDRARGGERGDDGLARADVALQQAVHRHAAAEVGVDLGADAALRARELERQRATQGLVQLAVRRRERRRALALALALGEQLRELLRQQLVELEALPRGMRSVLERGRGEAGRRLVQMGERFAQGRQPARHDAGRQVLVEVGARAPRRDRLAQGRLRQLHRARVDRRQRGRQRRFGRHDLERRVDHLDAEEAAARLAARAHALAGRERLLRRRVEVEEAQHQIAAVVGDLDDELAARPELDARVGDDAFDLAGVAVVQRRDRHDARLVLVA